MNKAQKIATQIMVTVVALLFLFPFFLIVMNSVKPLGDIISSPLKLPTGAVWDNYINSWNALNIPLIMKNTVILTFFSVAGIAVLASMSAYWVVRHPSRLTKCFNMLMISSMLIPFAAIMLPLVRFMRTLSLVNTLFGAIFVYWGIGVALAFFILQGSVKGVPIEIEEAAIIDGVNTWQLFWRIVFPLMSPTVITVVVMDIFWIWNDFMIPLVMLTGKDYTTVQYAIRSLFGSYRGQWDIALPGLVITSIPVIVAFILLQKKVVASITASSIKA